jgi:hypothetical protein
MLGFSNSVLIEPIVFFYELDQVLKYSKRTRQLTVLLF